jgi:hypothetical protein
MYPMAVIRVTTTAHLRDIGVPFGVNLIELIVDPAKISDLDI